MRQIFDQAGGTGDTTGTRLMDYSVRYTNFGLDAYLSYVDDKADNNTAAAAGKTRVGITTLTAAYTFNAFKVEGGVLSLQDKRQIAELRQQGLRPLIVGAIGEVAIAVVTLGMVLAADALWP